MRRGETYQYFLIGLLVLSTLLFGSFFYRELFPEYKRYQEAYVALEEFRARETGIEPAPFRFGVKQIVIPRQDGGPPTIDRCISCHVALDLPHFSKTALAKDVNGNLQRDEFGVPIQLPNPDYIFSKLDERVESLEKEGSPASLEEAKRLLELTFAKGALQAHPLIGRETRPFEFHSVEEMGCVSCHSGNGSALTAAKAHGPVFDGTYEEAFMGPKPQFLESDPENDPAFAKAYNGKPGHELLFQTTPILVGNLIEARCARCHEPKEIEPDTSTIEQDFTALIELLSMREWLTEKGVKEALNSYKTQRSNDFQPEKTLKNLEANIHYLANLINLHGENLSAILTAVDQDILQLVGSPLTKDQLVDAYQKNRDLSVKDVEALLGSEGLLAKKLQPLKNRHPLFSLEHYQEGKFLYLSQACYACHRIQGFARGGVGPELSAEGLLYPWFVKESITWPQADLKTSTMPNFRLDHEELEELMTFIMAQRPDSERASEVQKKIAIKAWESGKKLPFEEPVPSDQIRETLTGMRVFAVEGCAACHRLKGYTSKVALKTSEDHDWFQHHFPEYALGSEIKEAVEQLASEIDSRIAVGEEEKILDTLEKEHPGLLESFYAPFKFALRAKNHLEESERLPYIERVHKVLLVYIQEWGLGRLIGPRPNWSGVYRSDKWLMEHFANPSQLVPRSIMPIFPFDTTKFLALTHMLKELGKENRERFHQESFTPERAYRTLCSQCHGDQRKGNGPISEWIYPVPKNLTNPTFLRQLTKERAVFSILHGVQGTPMAPWGEGEKPVLSKEQAEELVEWLFADLPGESIIRKEENLKWNYTPEDVIEELKESKERLLEKKSARSLNVLPLYLGAISLDDLFDRTTAPGEPDSERTYIKKKFYTEENLEAGKQFFEQNCAVCHGKDADGAGERAEVMEDAKPRVLINFPWIESRDDLRLLRSINFGVPGTSMVAWGEVTTPLQRLQLVMYIRSLTDSKRDWAAFTNALYERFQRPIWDLQENGGSPQEIERLKREQQLLNKLGNQIYLRFGRGAVWNIFLEGISQNNVDVDLLKKAIQNEMDQIKQELVAFEGKITTQETKEEIQKLKGKLERQNEVLKEALSTFAEINQLRKEDGKESH